MSKDLYEYTEKLLELFEKSNLSTMEYEDEMLAVKFGKSGTVQKEHHSPVALEKEVVEEKTVSDFKAEVTSPIVGTFYTSPSPDASPFVQVGDVVKQGQTLCIVEAMKVMNEINAPIGGTIKEILVEDKEGVEFDQVLFRIK